MVDVILKPEDWAKLSAKAREEILHVMSAGLEETEGPGVPFQQMMKRLTGRDEPVVLNRDQVEALVVRIHPKTLAFLRRFARSNGKPYSEDLLTATGYQNYRQLTGVISGLTKRVRRILDDEFADLVVKKWDAAIPLHARNLENARYRMAPKTAEILRSVLGGEDGQT